MSRLHPGLPGAIITSSNEVYRDPDGTLRLGHHLILTSEQFEEYRQGYRCLACHTVQDEPFPEVCKEVYKDGGGCGYRMRDDQLRRIEFEFRGVEDLWHRDEEAERASRLEDAGLWLPGSG